MPFFREEVFASHISPEIKELMNRGTQVSIKEWKELRLNSYEREALLPFVSGEVLIDTIENSLKNCGPARRPAVTYDEAVIHLFMPEILSRFKKLTNQLSCVFGREL